MRGKIVAVALLASGLVLPAVSPAATTIGQTVPPGNTGCFTNTVNRQIAVTAGSGYSIPTRGVVTSWRTNAGGAPAGQLALVTMHANPGGGPNSFIYDAVDTVRTLAPSTLNLFTGTRLPIAAGGEIALFVPFNQASACLFPAAAGDTGNSASGAPSPGAGATFGPAGGGFRVNAAATVEPDLDGDGFGDETQDGCPASAKTQERCVCKSKPATIAGGPGRDVLTGTKGKDVISGLGGRDKLRGRGGKDVICGGPGRDKLWGGGGNDTLIGGGGKDSINQ